MKAPPYLNALALAVANLLLPELETFLDALHWTRVNAGALFNARRTAVNVFARTGI